ncbi:hypothetical protein [Ignicoccus islandicus]|uniref:hypothetical protein n=1 Tax=Ignicoccus islandicus TaxID=54259 RepID=UPI00143BD7B8|nr:hypothetical protein [Ignicoccus islandicus]
MARRSKSRGKKENLLIIASSLFILMFIGETIIMLAPRGSGSNVISREELLKYRYIPSPSNFTVMFFGASIKECPLCPETLSNVTQAINSLKRSELFSNTSIVMKVFQCNGFPSCQDKESLVNFKLYRVSQVPLVIISYRGFLVPIDVVGMSPQEIATLLAAWYQILKVAWKPPARGLVVAYFYDGNHTSPYWDIIKKELVSRNVTVVEFGCKSYPSNCTNNIEAYATMLALGISPNNLPLMLVFKDSAIALELQLKGPVNINEIVEKIETLKES